MFKQSWSSTPCASYSNKSQCFCSLVARNKSPAGGRFWTKLFSDKCQSYTFDSTTFPNHNSLVRSRLSIFSPQVFWQHVWTRAAAADNKDTTSHRTEPATAWSCLLQPWNSLHWALWKDLTWPARQRPDSLAYTAPMRVRPLVWPPQPVQWACDERPTLTSAYRLAWLRSLSSASSWPRLAPSSASLSGPRWRSS